MASSSENAEEPFDEYAAATRVDDLFKLVMKNKDSPQGAAAWAEAKSLARALGRNAARKEKESSSAPAATENYTVAFPVEQKVSCVANAAEAAALTEAFYGLTPVEEKTKEEKGKKYRKVRLHKADLDYILSYKSTPLPHPAEEFLSNDKRILDCYPVPPDQIVDYLTKLNSVFDDADDDFLEMQKRVRAEYNKKGYAHHWVTDDEDDATPSRAPQPARRRARPGVMKRKGGMKKIN
jgi:hypothetical protein